MPLFDPFLAFDIEVGDITGLNSELKPLSRAEQKHTEGTDIVLPF